MTAENIRRNALFTPQVDFLKDTFGRVNMDFVGRFETLEEDFATVANKLGIKAALPHINQSRAKAYQDFYTEKSLAVVEQLYAQDIAEFDYRFVAAPTAL